MHSLEYKNSLIESAKILLNIFEENLHKSLLYKFEHIMFLDLLKGVVPQPVTFQENEKSYEESGKLKIYFLILLFYIAFAS